MPSPSGAGVDDPARFRRSRDVGPHFGLTPRKYQSGEVDVTGSISKVGDRMVRTALYEAASVMLSRTVRMSPLKSWAIAVARRRGSRKARVALARKLGVVLHRMWVDGTSFRWTSEAAPWHKEESLRRSGQPARPARGPTAGTVKTVKPQCPQSLPRRRRSKDRLAASSDRMMWQLHR